MKRIISSFACFSFYVIAFFLGLSEGTANSVTVKTNYGDVQGKVMNAPADFQSQITKINTFYGIPFAAPPVGELRFQPPKPPRAWKPDVYNATYFRNVCIQGRTDEFEKVCKKVIPNFSESNYGEDCLYLNVYAPAQKDPLHPTTKYPVLFYIHGGAFIWGSGILTNGLGLCTYGVVLVTIQYRLGPFGFLYTGDSSATGNYAMLDQIKALKWVKENIKNFGGDPDKVTIFGSNTGATSVGVQLLSPLSKNLFHRAISESGVSFCPWAFATPQVAKERTKNLAKKSGCNHEGQAQMVECLRKKDAWKLTSPSLEGNYWSPVIDKEMGKNAFLPDTPQNLVNAGKLSKLPYMVGFMPNEGAIYVPQLVNITLHPALFKVMMNVYASFGLKRKDVIHVVQDAMEMQYTPWGDTSDQQKLKQAVVDLLTDSKFVAPIVKECKEHSAHAPTYLFEVNYRPTFSVNPHWMGPTHEDNHWLAFGPPFPGNPSYTEVDKNVSLLVMKLYTNFVKVGNPTPKHLANGITWPAFNSTNLAYLRIQPNPEKRRNIYPQRMAFWNVFYPQILKHACNSTKGKDITSGAELIHTCNYIICFLLGALLCVFSS